MAISAGSAKRLVAVGRSADQGAQDAHHDAANDVSVDQSEDRDARHGIFAEVGREQRIADSGKGGDRRQVRELDAQRPAALGRRRFATLSGGGRAKPRPCRRRPLPRLGRTGFARRRAHPTRRAADATQIAQGVPPRARGAATVTARQRRPSRRCCAWGSLAVLVSHRHSKGNFVVARTLCPNSADISPIWVRPPTARPRRIRPSPSPG